MGILRRVLPDSVVNGCKRALGLPVHLTVEPGEKGPEYYDRAFDDDDPRRQHYTSSSYYFLWTVIVDRLRRLDARSVLEIGCGPGQLAAAIYDAHLIREYHGFDFSEPRVLQARRACPAFSFAVADAYTTDIFDTFRYDTAIATEFLEHVAGDLEILAKLPSGTRFLGTVPNFPYVSHVRHFSDDRDVLDRYQQVLQSCSVSSFLENDQGKTFFLIEGVR